MDHAGGLELFKVSPCNSLVYTSLSITAIVPFTQGSKIPVWVHELELKAAFYGVATGADDQCVHRSLY